MGDAKTLEVYAELADRVLTVGIDKLSILISLGGGAVANVCGFIASTLHRGIGLIHFPTTLLAQCDAAISHKQAVNAPHGKNLVGSYYAPIRIVVDPDVLQTLDDWLLPDGMGEIVKHALCQDATLLKMLDEYDGPLTDPAFLERVVRRTIELKCQVIDIDPKEKREAVVLVYGHTLGHPIEAIIHRPGSLCCLPHGQAVAIGCVVAARVAVKMGLCDHAVIQRTVDLCKKYELPTVVPADQSVDRIMAKLPYNKTWTQEGTVMALLEDIGRLFNVDQSYLLPVSESVIREAVTETMAPRARSSEVLVVRDSYVETRSRRTTSSRRRTSLFLALVGTRIAPCRTPVNAHRQKSLSLLPSPPPTTTLVRLPRRLRPQTTLYTAESKIPLPRPMGAPTWP